MGLLKYCLKEMNKPIPTAVLQNTILLKWLISQGMILL